MRRVGFLAVLLLALGGSACSSKIIVGVVLPETGEASAYGTSVKTGAKLAFDQAAAARTLPPGLEVVYQDTGSSPSKGADLADALYKRGALIVIGGATSPEAKVMTRVATKYGRMLLSPSASTPDLTSKGGWFFRVYPSDEGEGVKAAQFLVQDRKVKNVLVIKEDIAYTQGLLPVFTTELTKLGGRVVGTVSVSEPNWERMVAASLSSLKPEALYVCGYGEAILAAMVEVRNTSYTGIVCTTSAISTVDLVWRGGKLVEGLFFPMVMVDMTSTKEPIAGFVKRYREAYNLQADIYAAHGYDAALATLYALAAPAPKSATELRSRFLTLGSKIGVTGPMNFDDTGNITEPLRVHWIREGKVELYQGQ
jgi:branched-chain amino acid transport system substrate-binding protein